MAAPAESESGRSLLNFSRGTRTKIDIVSGVLMSTGVTAVMIGTGASVAADTINHIQTQAILEREYPELFAANVDHAIRLTQEAIVASKDQNAAPPRLVAQQPHFQKAQEFFQEEKNRRDEKNKLEKKLLDQGRMPQDTSDTLRRLVVNGAYAMGAGLLLLMLNHTKKTEKNKESLKPSE